MDITNKDDNDINDDDKGNNSYGIDVTKQLIP